MIANLKPYSLMKDSSVEWLGEVPKHWEVRKLRSVLRGVAERNRPDLPLLSVVREKGVILRDITSKEENRNFIPDDLTNYKLVRKGQFAMNKMKAWQGSYGISRHDGIVSPAYFIFDVEGVGKDYFHVAIRSKAYVPFFTQASDGVRIGQWDLSQVRMREIPFTIPPLPEQSAIVRYLDYVDWRVQRYMRAKKNLIGLLEEQKQAIIHRAVTRGLNPDVPLKPSGVEWLADVPEHWELRRLKSSVTHINEQTSEKNPEDLYIALEHVESWTGRLQIPDNDVEFDSQVKRFNAEDVLFGKLRPYLAKVVKPSRPGVCVGEFLVLRPNTTLVLSAYLESILRSKPVIDEINGSTFGAKMPRADWGFVGCMSIALPPLIEQAEIIEYLDRATNAIDTAINRAHREIELLREYHTRLIAGVATGKLDVREAAANLPDEPEPVDESDDLMDKGDAISDDFDTIPEEPEA